MNIDTRLKATMLSWVKHQLRWFVQWCSAYIQRKFKPAVGFGTRAVTVALRAGGNYCSVSQSTKANLLKGLETLTYLKQIREFLERLLRGFCDRGKVGSLQYVLFLQAELRVAPANDTCLTHPSHFLELWQTSMAETDGTI